MFYSFIILLKPRFMSILRSGEAIITPPLPFSLRRMRNLYTSEDYGEILKPELPHDITA
jgi:hypothetical protein